LSDWELNWTSGGVIGLIIAFMIVESVIPGIGAVEVGVGKLIARSLGAVFAGLVLLLNACGVIQVSSWIQPIMSYVLGYLSTSAGFQLWMLSTHPQQIFPVLNKRDINTETTEK
jgi:hypothetical protein